MPSLNENEPVHIIDTLAGIEAWLRANTPATAAELGPPATDSDLDHIRQSLGLNLPEDLVTLLCWHNGGGDSDMPMTIAPGCGMLSAQAIVKITALNRSVGGPTTSPSPWKPSWLVIGSTFTDSFLIIETGTRAEDNRHPTGSVFTFNFVDGAMSRGPAWPAVADTLATMLATLHDGESPEGLPVEVTDDGHLDW